MTERTRQTLAEASPCGRRAVARRVRGLSDRAIAWLFILPTMALLARDQHLSADLGDPAVVHRIDGQSADPGRVSSASTIMSTS